ncbi:MAG: AraC family transcriptional regulator [Treponemataceae bacterium]|nr:AraC family transcriptional regulator [Treponemataceae bacterium]
MYFSLNTDILPHIYLMGKCVNSKDWMHPRRVASQFILFIILSGTMYLQEDDKRYELQAGDYIFLQPGRTHFGYRACECEFYYIHFQSECLIPWDCNAISQIKQIIVDNDRLAYKCDPLGDSLYTECKLFIPKDRHVNSSSTMQHLSMLIDDTELLEKSQTPHYKLVSSSRFLEILTLLSRDFVFSILPCNQKKSSSSMGKANAVTNYLNMNYASPISGELLASAFAMNFDSLNRLYKRATGLTIFDHLRQIRLTRARELLVMTSLRLDEISRRTGFCDQYYFSHVFKQEFGVSPRKYMK